MKKRIVSLLLALCLLAGAAGSMGAYPAKALEDSPGEAGEERAYQLYNSGGSGDGPPLVFWDQDDNVEMPIIPAPEPDYELPGLPDEDPPLTWPDYGLDKKYQTPVRNQGRNGLCWAFGTVAAIEANLLKKTGRREDFSEAHMGYALSDHSGNTTQGHDRKPSDGGSAVMAQSYLMRGTDLSGLVLEAEDTIVSANGGTKFLQDRPLSETRGKEKSYQVGTAMTLTGGTKEPSDKTVIRDAIMLYGAVEASMYWPGTATEEGVDEVLEYYNPETCAFYYNGAKTREGYEDYMDTTHAVTFVGWDDNYSRENFSQGVRPEKDGAWLVKNSWGTDWGDGGYFWISYEDTNAPLYANCYDGVEKTDPTAHVYETDYASRGSSLGYSGATSAYYAKAFTTTEANEALESVRVYVGSKNVRVSVDAFTVPSAGSVMNKLKSRSMETGGSLEVEFSGWYTIDLQKPLTVQKKGEQLVVVVKIDNYLKGESVLIGYDKKNPLDQEQTFFSKDGSAWGSDNRNLCIKAVMKPVTGPNQIGWGDVSASDKLTYNGSEQEPEITVQKSGRTLQKGTDYQVDYAGDRKDPGSFTATVRGIGSYTGSVPLKFEIQKAELKAEGLSLPKNITLTRSGGEYTPYFKLFFNMKLSGICGKDDVHLYKAIIQTPDVYSGTYDKLTVTKAELTGRDASKYRLAVPVEMSMTYTVKGKPGKVPEATAAPDGTPGPSSPGATPRPWVNPYPDVSSDSPQMEAIEFVSINGLMNGNANGTFGANDPLTRAQFVQILYNKEDRPGYSPVKFTDVASTKWYAPAIYWAAGKGYVNGTGNGAFSPEMKLTREQLLTMLWRYSGSPKPSGDTSFSDFGKVSEYARDAVKWASGKGLMEGVAGRAFEPRKNALRGEVAQILMNLLEG